MKIGNLEEVGNYLRDREIILTQQKGIQHYLECYRNYGITIDFAFSNTMVNIGHDPDVVLIVEKYLQNQLDKLEAKLIKLGLEID